MGSIRTNSPIYLGESLFDVLSHEFKFFWNFHINKLERNSLMKLVTGLVI